MKISPDNMIRCFTHLLEELPLGLLGVVFSCDTPAHTRKASRRWELISHSSPLGAVNGESLVTAVSWEHHCYQLGMRVAGIEPLLKDRTTLPCQGAWQATAIFLCRPVSLLAATVAPDLCPYRTEVYHPLKQVMHASIDALTSTDILTEFYLLVNS